MTWPATPGSHAVQFYESERFLHDAVLRFLTEGARRGGPLVMLSRRCTFEAVAARLASHRILFVDAEAVVSNATNTTGLDWAGLELTLVDLLGEIDRLSEQGTVWIYGELVDLLCQQGHHQAAVQVETCWNRLIAGRRSFVVVCGYAIERFDADTTDDALQAIFRQHTHVIPTEQVVDAPDDRGRSERVVLLEQRVRRALGRAVAQPAAAATAPPAAVTAPIYVVDDDASVRKSLERLLLSVDLTVRSFSSAEELLAAVDGSPGGCLIVDVQLLGMSGTELQQRLAHAKDRWPIIAMSGAYDAQIEHDALRQGAVAFLRKPFAAEALFDAIARATSSSRAPCRP